MEPESARKIKSFVQLLKDGKRCERVIDGRIYRYEFHDEPTRHCDISVGSFLVATVWNDRIQFTLPTPINNYFRMRVNNTCVECKLDWGEECSVVVRAAELHYLAVVGITNSVKIECSIGNRLLAQFTHQLSKQKKAVLRTLEGEESCYIRMCDKKVTGVEALFVYVRNGKRLESVTLKFPIGFVRDSIGTLRVACLEQAQSSQNFDAISSDSYMPDDWEIYKTTINALSELCVIMQAYDDTSVPHRIEEEDEEEESGEIQGTPPKISSIETGARMVPYFEVSEENTDSYVITDGMKKQKRIVWLYETKQGKSRWTPFIPKQIFLTAEAVWSTHVPRGVRSLISSSSLTKVDVDDSLYDEEEATRTCPLCICWWGSSGGATEDGKKNL